jgi:apolipoprotein N-acyltransferase
LKGRPRRADVALFGWAALGGALYCLGYVGFGIWPLALVAWAVFFLALEGTRARRASVSALAGFVFGFVAHAGGYAWLWRLVDVFLGGQRALGAALWGAHAIWFSAAYALYALLYRALRARGWPIALAGSAPLVAVEWLYPQLFPAHLGDAFVDRTRFVQIADLGGPLAVTALAVLVNAALFESYRWARGDHTPPLATGVATLLALSATAGYGVFREAALAEAMATAPALRVGIVQGNADVMEKRRDPERMHALYLTQTRELLAEGPLDLVVWPETVYTRGIQGPLPVAGQLIARDLGVPLLFGAASVRAAEDGRARRYNSAFLIGADGTIRDGYDKNLLVPFAERLPFGEPLRGLFPHAQDFGAAEATPALRLGAWRIATPICYEAAVPAFVRRMVAEAQPNLLVMLSNDAWFGDSHEPWIHLAVARMRAIEHHRFVVRATNSGISAVIDPAGRLLAQSGLGRSENLRGTVRMLGTPTFYGRAGDWIGWLAAAGCGVMLLVGAPRYGPSVST